MHYINLLVIGTIMCVLVCSCAEHSTYGPIVVLLAPLAGASIWKLEKRALKAGWGVWSVAPLFLGVPLMGVICVLVTYLR